MAKLEEIKNFKMERANTLAMSSDYKERFVGEYMQLKIRTEKLEVMLAKWDAGTLEFTPTCMRSIYNGQIHAMKEYLMFLENRATIEDIDLVAIANAE